MAVLLAGVLLFSAPGCVLTQYRVPTVKLGLVAPLAGVGADEGYRWVFAAKQAIAEWNATPGRSPRVELVSYDDADGPVVARRLAVDARVAAVIGHWRPDVAADAWPIYAAAGLPALAFTYGGCETGGVKGVWCVAPNREALGGAAAEFIGQRFGRDAPVAVVAGPDVGDLVVAEGMRASLSAAGLNVVRAEAAYPYATSYLDVARRIAAERAAAVVFTGSTAAGADYARDAATVAREGRRVGLTVLATHLPDPPADATTNAALLAPFGQPTGEAYDRFRTAYQQAWGQAPTVQAAAVYDATRIVLRALEPAGPGLRSDAARALQAAPPFTGLLGEYRVEAGQFKPSIPPAVLPLPR